MEDMLEGINCTTNKNAVTEPPKAIVDCSIFDGNSSFFILFLRMCISKDPIPSPKNATDIAIKA